VSWLNSALWSLRWEVEFSLLLPLYLLVLTPRLPKLWWAKLLLLLALVAAGTATGHDSLRYLPMFGCGVILFSHRDHLPAVRGRVAGASALVALLLAWAYWAAVPHGVGPVAVGVVEALQVAAAVWVVLAAERWAPVSCWLAKPTPHWLGSRSFALYLTHEPIVVSVALLTHSIALTLLIALPLSLAFAEGFYRVIEHPSHRMSRTFGRAVSGQGRAPIDGFTVALSKSAAR
jgi:peptidoglycan/LPS O-acetylase OafA/YrhL